MRFLLDYRRRAPSFDHILEKILGYLAVSGYLRKKIWRQIFLQNVGYVSYCYFIQIAIVLSSIHTGFLIYPNGNKCWLLWKLWNTNQWFEWWKDIFLQNVGYFNYSNFILNVILPSFIHRLLVYLNGRKCMLLWKWWNTDCLMITLRPVTTINDAASYKNSCR